MLDYSDSHEHLAKTTWRNIASGGRHSSGESIVASARIDWRRIHQDSSIVEVKPKPPGASEMIKNYVGFIQNFLLVE
jgi:hypothetical protein